MKKSYKEIDVLTQSIVHFSEKEKVASLKTDKIISMVNLPLGTFEHIKNTDYVLCSESFIKLFNIPDALIVKNKVNAQAFFAKMNEIKLNAENKDENIFMVKGNVRKWFKIVTYEDDNSIWGICLDVSKEILDKHIVEYERDYDSLTRLLNREAFRRKVEELFQNKIEKYSALVLFDIDNLRYVNDTYGHKMGDHYITTMANVLYSTLKNNCIVGRMAGDEFYIFAHGFNSKEEIRAVFQLPFQH